MIFHLVRTGARTLCGQPSYLICTNPELPPEDLLQEYIWRWDIEVNHRDEKTILGVGQAQVRTTARRSQLNSLQTSAAPCLRPPHYPPETKLQRAA